MSDSMQLQVVSRRNKDGTDYFEGVVTLPANLCPTKLQKSDGTTRFSTRSALVQAARSVGRKLDYEVTETTQVKKAAKKSATKKAKVTPIWPQ